MADDRSSHWVSVVPEIFYDVLARILPGFVCSLVAANIIWAFHRCLLSQTEQSNTNYSLQSLSGGATLGVILAALAIFWAIGLLLTPSGDRLCRMRLRAEILIEMVRGHQRLFAQAERLSILVHEHGPGIWVAIAAGKCDEGFAGIVYQQLHEYLKGRKDAWQGVLTKNQAEVTFYGNVYGGMLWTLVGSVLLVPACLVISGRGSVWVLWSHSGVLFFCMAMIPPIFIAVSAQRGASAKHRRLWLRHVACLTVDLKEIKEQHVPEQNAAPATAVEAVAVEAIELDS